MWRGAGDGTPQRGEQLSFAKRFLDEVDASIHDPLGVQDSPGVARHEQHRHAGPLAHEFVALVTEQALGLGVHPRDPHSS